MAYPATEFDVTSFVRQLKQRRAPVSKPAAAPAPTKPAPAMPANLGPSQVGSPDWLAYHGERLINEGADMNLPGANRLRQLGQPMFDARRAAVTGIPAQAPAVPQARRAAPALPSTKGSKPLSAEEIARLRGR